MKFLILGSLCALPALGAAQLTEAERAGLEDALFIGNMRVEELNYERRGFLDRLRPSIIDDAIQRPIETANAVMEMHLVTKRSMSDMLRAGRQKLVPTQRAIETVTKDMEMFPALPANIRKPFGTLISALQTANADVELALSALGPAERQTLIQSLPYWAVEEKAVKFDFVNRAPASWEQTLGLARQVDFDKLLAAGVSLSVGVEKAMNQLRGVVADIPAPIKLQLGDLKILVTGRGDDKISGSDYDLILDLGGNDTYSGRPAFGVQRARVAIDLGGNDTFDVADGGGGVGLLGCGIMRVVGGNDVFRGGNLAFGAGLLGVGALAKEGGEDVYIAQTLSQGFGQFGMGVLIDTDGTDQYRLGLMGQGAGRTQGLGWLVDRTGDDTYKAGGITLNSPLFKDIYYSFAQGFGMGYREDSGGTSGGIGLLTDLSGMDSYLGQTYCQGASYWYGLGSLFDGSGHDTYSAYHYAQASAMHICAAYLFDLRGDDGYLTKFGASHAIGHDAATAMLLDRDGNDIYSARDSAPGTGNAGGVGIFLDSSGEDRYQGPPGQGNPSRGSGSVGLFVDLGGQDKYYAGIHDSEAAASGSWGVAYDLEDPFRPKSETPEVEQPVAQPGSLARPNDAELKRIYDLARQWGVGTAQQSVADNIQKLVLIGMPAFDWMLDKELANVDRLSVRTFAAVIRGIGQPARDRLAERLLQSQKEAELRNGLSIASEAGVREVGPVLSRLIRTPSLQRQAVRAAGTIQAREAVPELLPLVAGVDRTIALAAMVSLSQIGSEEAYTTAEAVVTQPNLMMRKAALALLAKFPTNALATSRRLLEGTSETQARTGLELLSLIGTADALKELGERLGDPSAGMRIQALLGLAGRCPAEFRPLFTSLRDDPVPTVKAVARRLTP
ncbi:MAG: hypothetical protein JNJ45_07005 [Chthonomonas sp.]|nr:hypothetical protein [Chthonomonas sp.]